MKLLLDANISWRLAVLLKPHFEDCLHVENAGLKNPATDIEIWTFAAANNFIIITNDDDFLNLAQAKGSPPKVVLLRTGNQSNEYIGNLLLRHKNEISELSGTSDYGFLEIF